MKIITVYLTWPTFGTHDININAKTESTSLNMAKLYKNQYTVHT